MAHSFSITMQPYPPTYGFWFGGPGTSLWSSGLRGRIFWRDPVIILQDSRAFLEYWGSKMAVTDAPARPMKNITLYTDGACLGNPGPGGWCAILIYGAVEKEVTGGEAQTTNNRMELTAAIEGLRALKEPCVVKVHTDSRYVSDAFNKRWLNDWEKRGWRKADKKPVMNEDLWQELLALTRTHKVTFYHVAGHSGHPVNERCDCLAQKAASSFVQ